MKLKISAIKEQGLEIYITRNESNDRAYVMRERYLFFKKELQLYDAHKKYIAEALTTFRGRKYIFKEHDKIIDEMHLVSTKLKNQYQLLQSKWSLDVDITFTEYTLFSFNFVVGNIVGYIVFRPSIKCCVLSINWS